MSSLSSSFFENAINLSKARALELYNKQEYFRKAYNEVASHIRELERSLPRWVIDYYNSFYFHNESTTEDNIGGSDLPEHNSDEEEIDINPDLLNFMIQTYRHREAREKDKSTSCISKDILPLPPKPLLHSQSDSTSHSSELAKQISDCIYSLNYYCEYASECRDAPLWPQVPLCLP
ncbi:unnamed protein product [Protopolystoma xenopodis]|uniref:Uncharacterized protein n=1 Tax=Protopolystoma xenopodis TaxID=117903 RepID=A0A448WM43_9PLAT|nr:unnamed protein product [Protopolystoma xenopodis]